MDWTGVAVLVVLLLSHAVVSTPVVAVARGVAAASADVSAVFPTAAAGGDGEGSWEFRSHWTFLRGLHSVVVQPRLVCADQALSTLRLASDPPRVELVPADHLSRLRAFACQPLAARKDTATTCRIDVEWHLQCVRSCARYCQQPVSYNRSHDLRCGATGSLPPVCQLQPALWLPFDLPSTLATTTATTVPGWWWGSQPPGMPQDPWNPLALCGVVVVLLALTHGHWLDTTHHAPLSDDEDDGSSHDESSEDDDEGQGPADHEADNEADHQEDDKEDHGEPRLWLLQGWPSRPSRPRELLASLRRRERETRER